MQSNFGIRKEQRISTSWKSAIIFTIEEIDDIKFGHIK